MSRDCCLSFAYCAQICESCVLAFRTRGFKRHAAAFMGNEAVTWMINKGLAGNQEQAERLGNELLRLGLLFEVSFKHAFRNKPYLYRCAPRICMPYCAMIEMHCPIGGQLCGSGLYLSSCSRHARATLPSMLFCALTCKLWSFTRA